MQVKRELDCCCAASSMSSVVDVGMKLRWVEAMSRGGIDSFAGRAEARFRSVSKIEDESDLGPILSYLRRR